MENPSGVFCAVIGPLSQRRVPVFQKLKAIEELKEQQASGKVLQKNQVTSFIPHH